jgi:hypothetical protein
MLSPKLHPTRPQAQPLPYKHFRRRHSPPQPARHLDGILGSLPHPNLPLQSSPWPKGHGEVAAAKRLTEGQRTQRRRPSTNACGVGPPPMPTAQGGIPKAEPPPVRTSPPQILPVAKRWGSRRRRAAPAGPLAKRVVEGRVSKRRLTICEDISVGPEP